jgi:hypothetical protein
MWLRQVRLQSRCSPRYSTSSAWGSWTLFIWTGGQVSLRVVKAIRVDAASLDPFYTFYALLTFQPPTATFADGHRLRPGHCLSWTANWTSSNSKMAQNVAHESQWHWVDPYGTTEVRMSVTANNQMAYKFVLFSSQLLIPENTNILKSHLLNLVAGNVLSSGVLFLSMTHFWQ